MVLLPFYKMASFRLKLNDITISIKHYHLTSYKISFKLNNCCYWKWRL